MLTILFLFYFTILFDSILHFFLVFIVTLLILLINLLFNAHKNITACTPLLPQIHCVRIPNFMWP